MIRILSIVGLLLSIQLQAQTTLKGRVVSAETGEGLPRASVYLSGTTLGTVTDDEGNFSLSNLPNQPFDLNASFVGYQTGVVNIASTGTAPITISLKADVKMLGEVVVRADDRLWSQYGQKFLKDFIGTSAFAEQVTLLNPEDLILDFDNEEKLLSIFASKPLIIENKALGYRLTYWLDAYEYSYRTGQVIYKGYPFFEDLAQKEGSKRKVKQWTKNRASAYNGSFTHFVSALYRDQLKEEGFKVDKLERIPISSYYEKTVKEVDTMFYNNSAVENIHKLIQERYDNPMFAATFLKTVKDWYNREYANPLRIVLGAKDGFEAQAFELHKDDLNPEKIVTKKYPIDPEIEKQAKNGIIGVISEQDIDTQAFLDTSKPPVKTLKFDNFWNVTYLKEKEELAYQKRSLRFKEYVRKNQTSIISITQPSGLDIYENGYFAPPSAVLTEGYWSFEKIDKLLPLNYQTATQNAGNGKSQARD